MPFFWNTGKERKGRYKKTKVVKRASKTDSRSTRKEPKKQYEWEVKYYNSRYKGMDYQTFASQAAAKRFAKGKMSVTITKKVKR